MGKKVVFYCHFGAGDIFESREFVKHYMEEFDFLHGPDVEYYYAHGRPPYILHDMERLKFTKVTPRMKTGTAYKEEGDTLYINMWIGRDGKYVLPNVGCVVEKFYDMHNEILRWMRLPRLRKEVYSYIPRVNYSKYKIDGVDKFVKEVINNHKQTVLICNGRVNSHQAKNFDFTPVIRELCESTVDHVFIETEKSGIDEDMLFYTGDIIGETPGTDLNEISYLSTFCDVIVGRNSGPFVFTQVLDNWIDKNKTSISFTYARHASHFVHSDVLPMRKEWSGATNPGDVFEKIVGVIA